MWNAGGRPLHRRRRAESGCRQEGLARSENASPVGPALNELNRGYPLPRADPSQHPGTTKGVTNRLSAPAYWKFESTSLQR